LQYLRFSGGINPEIIAVAKYPEQYQLAQELGAQYIISPSETGRVVRKRTASLMAGTHLTTGVDIVIDCVGSRDSLRNALDVVSPKGKIVLVGMPGETRIDMAPLWYKEITLQGAYTYSPTTFDTATKVVVTNHLERLVSAKYRLENFEDAIAHAAKAGQRGAIKVVFDMRKKPRNIQREQPS
jgi:threonine dehydrogenase-like Zn-dependent dehydrogenase